MYVSPTMLANLWQRLVDWTVTQAGMRRAGRLSGGLRPQWARVGRVTLHLAENKGRRVPVRLHGDLRRRPVPRRPPARLPLGRALEEYAGARRKPELLKLLSPLHAAAKRSELIADLVETGDIFHPLVWTPSEAHAFLKEIPLYEECGLLAQLPELVAQAGAAAGERDPRQPQGRHPRQGCPARVRHGSWRWATRS